MKKTRPLAKVILLSLFLAVFITNTSAQKVTLSFQNETFEKVLNSIKQQTGLSLVFSEQLVNLNRKVSIKVNSIEVEDALKQLLTGTNLGYEIKNNKLYLIENKNSEPKKAVGPSKKINGLVTDKKGDPIIGATIIINGSNTGTITNIDGAFTIEAHEQSVVTISYIGYKQTIVKIGALNNLKIVLEEDSKTLDEVVVIGYGERKKKDITTSISSVSSEKITKTVSLSPELAMQGQMSGIRVQGNQGDPNARPELRIRGVNTWGVASPIYVIDGIPIKEYGSGIEGSSVYTRGNINIMSMIDPNDIESISVLKDAAAAAIYGVRASNGVILITTKKGRKEKTMVDFNSKVSVMNQYQRLDMMNTQEYTEYFHNYFLTDPNWESSIYMEDYDTFFPEGKNYLGNSPTYDWQSAGINKNALQQDYSVRISGGTDKTDYAVSLSYADYEGTQLNNNTKRYSGSVNINMDLNQYVRTGVNVRLVNAGGATKGDVSTIIERATTPPWQPIYDLNGVNGYAQVVVGYRDNGTWDSNRLYNSITRNNYLGEASMINKVNSSNRLLGTAFLEIEPIKGLKIKGTASLDYFTNDANTFEIYDIALFRFNGKDPTGQPVGSTGYYEVINNTQRNTVYELSANYAKSFEKHNFDFLLNGMWQEYRNESLRPSTTYITTKDIDLLGFSAANEYTSISSGHGHGRLIGQLARIGYNYDSKYYLDATIRRDGSTRFAPENRWGVFPGVSAAWRISSEPFLNSNDWIDDIKLRGSWGELGNQEVNDLAYLQPITKKTNYAFGNDPSAPGLGYEVMGGASVSGMANRNLKWERTRTFNAGVDFTLFSSLNGSFEWYDKMTYGILQSVTLPLSVGIESQPVDNIAAVQNTGIEFNLQYQKKIGNFNFSVGGNLTTVENTVHQMYNGIPIGTIEEGYPMNYLKGYEVGGMFQSRNEALDYMDKYTDTQYREPLVSGGDLWFVDQRGAPTAEDIANGVNMFYSPIPDGIIDSYDQVMIGKSIPGYYYGINLGAEWKGIDFSMNFTGLGDLQKFNPVIQRYLNPTKFPTPQLRQMKNTWTTENPNTNIPRAVFNGGAANGRTSTYFVEDADYFRCSNVQLGYTLPQSASKVAVKLFSNARIYLGCQNIFTITKYTGLDPEDDNNPAPFIFYSGCSFKF